MIFAVQVNVGGFRGQFLPYDTCYRRDCHRNILHVVSRHDNNLHTESVVYHNYYRTKK